MATRLAIRSADVGPRIDAFLVSAIVTVLLIRIYLAAAGYPSIGGSQFHIAHLLPGGLLMMGTIIMMLAFLTSRAERVGAVTGGIGFGFFIDELGKFITSDNDYFFKPTAALIYVTFIVIYLLQRQLFRRRGLSQEEYLINAVEQVKEAGIADLDQREKARAMEYLERADQKDPLVRPLRRVVAGLHARQTEQPRWYHRYAAWLRQTYFALVEKPIFIKGVTAFFIISGAVSFLTILAIVFAGTGAVIDLDIGRSVVGMQERLGNLSFTSWATLLSSLVSGVMLLIGTGKLAESRLAAYLWFDRSLLVTIFLTEVFAFAAKPLLASLYLATTLLLLVAINYLIELERRRK